MKKIVFFTALISLLISCAPSDQKITLRNSNGHVNQVLVVMDNNIWQGVEGDELRKVTGEEVLGLPQRESQFRVIQIPTNAFKNLFALQKNILKVSYGNETKITIKSDVYANSQRVITLKATSKEALIKLIQENKKEIITTFKNADLKFLQRRLRKSQFDISKLKTLNNLKVSLEIPFDYKFVDDTGDFLWMRKHINQGQSMNLIVYELPINSKDDEDGKNIVSVRDTIGKKHLPGESENAYLITEQAYSPHIFDVELDGKKAFETRGKWEVKNEFMAGPFLNYTVVDKANNRLVVVEGFTYAPTKNKRDFMFELEAILKTLKIK